jgi:hypothetical protein
MTFAEIVPRLLEVEASSMPNAECRMPNAECGMPKDASFKLPVLPRQSTTDGCSLGNS